MLASFAGTARILLGLAPIALAAQTLVDDDRAAEIDAKLSASAAATPFRCRVQPLGPQLDFALKSQVGYDLRFPLEEFADGRGFDLLVRAVPESASAAPLYFDDHYRMPALPADLETRGKSVEKSEGDVEQWLPLPPARYRIDVLAQDEDDRVCRAGWTVELPAPLAPPRVPPVRRLTLLINTSGNSQVLAESASTVLAWLPADAVRVVAFSLDAEKELFRSADFRREAFDDLAKALEGGGPAPLDYRLLQTYNTPAGFLADILAREFHDRAPADTLVLLNGQSVGSSLPDVPRGSGKTGPRLFYLHLSPSHRIAQPAFARASPPPCDSAFRPVPSPAGMAADNRGCTSMPPLPFDPIANAVERLRGKVMPIAEPADLARALTQIGKGGR